MTNLHIGNNGIPVETMNEIIALIEAEPAMKVLCAIPFRDKTIKELNVSGQNLGIEGALVIRRYFENAGALEKFDISDNALYEEGTNILAESLRGNQVMVELNLARNDMGPDGAMDIAKTIPTMGAMTTITFGDEEAVTMKADMTEADLSGKELGASGVHIVAAFIPKCQ